ncbi:MAG: sulfatase-like hydrolase/transferase [Deltaproteobacteria bacterium]|nr:sulfatase-like hydrolase/transferase [Deltaproteobacteria bacterium]
MLGYDSFFPLMNWVRETPDTNAAELINRYDEEIAYTDEALGNFFEALRRRNLYHNAWIIVTSDHGEEFLEHGNVGHSTTMYDEVMHVPLIVKAPRSLCGGTRLAAGQFPQSAIARLILHIAREPDATSDARACDPATGTLTALTELIANEPVVGDTRIFGDPRFMARTTSAKLLSPASIVKGEEKEDRAYEFYDLSADPRETVNLYERGVAPPLENLITEAREATAETPGSRRRLSPDAVKKLKSLGYIQ